MIDTSANLFHYGLYSLGLFALLICLFMWGVVKKNGKSIPINVGYGLSILGLIASFWFTAWCLMCVVMVYLKS